MERLASENREKLIDLLKERFTFECTGVKLYDKVLQRLTVTPELLNGLRVAEYRSLSEKLRSIRDEEQEHAEWLAGQIELLGGNPRRKGDASYFVTREAAGIEDVILHTESPIPQLFHALLAAELSDTAGWDLLMMLADEAGDYRARAEFERRFQEEERHLQTIRQCLSRMTLAEVLPTHVPVHAGV